MNERIIVIKKNKPVIGKMCVDCANAEYIGDGDYVCYENAVPKLVMIDFTPSKDFNYCRGRKWLEQ